MFIQIQESLLILIELLKQINILQLRKIFNSDNRTAVKVLYTPFLAPSPFPAVSLTISLLLWAMRLVPSQCLWPGCCGELWHLDSFARTKGMLTLPMCPSCPWHHLGLLCLWEGVSVNMFWECVLLGLKIHIRSNFSVSDVPHAC